MNQTKKTAPMKGALLIQLPGRNPLELCRDEMDKRVLTNKIDFEMMRRPWLWPVQNLLPLKRHSTSGEMEYGFIGEGYKCGVFVIHLGLWAQPVGRMYCYEDPEDAVAAGWRVD